MVTKANKPKRPKPPDILRKGGPMKDKRKQAGRKAKHKDSQDPDD